MHAAHFMFVIDHPFNLVASALGDRKRGRGPRKEGVLRHSQTLVNYLKY